MSIKTLRKRIALVAVSALGAGFMTVVAVPSANAAALAAGQLTVYGNLSSGAAAGLRATGTVDDTTSTNGGYSQGLLTQSTTGAAIGGANQLTQTATVRLDGGVAVGFLPTSTKWATIGVVGGTITASSSSGTDV